MKHKGLTFQDFKVCVNGDNCRLSARYNAKAWDSSILFLSSICICNAACLYQLCPYFLYVENSAVIKMT